MTTFSYLRVSTIDQATEKNKLEILQFVHNNKLGNVIFTEEKITGKVHYKDRELGRLLGVMKKGDVLIVPELSRLARSVSQILEIINLCKQNEFTLYSLKESFNSGDSGITSVITSTVFALVAQIERDLISQRTKEALHSKRASGVKLGRPKGKKGKSKLDAYRDTIIKLNELRVPKTIIAKQFNTTVPNLYNYLKTINHAEARAV